MSRIAKYPVVDVPKGVEVTLTDTEVSVKGPLGTLKQFMLPAVKIERDGEQLMCRAVEGAPNAGAMSGTMRALLNNMVTRASPRVSKRS
jgi:large subunit ribosomal protein L6